MKKPRYKAALALSYEGKDDETPRLTLKEDVLSADEVIKIAKRFGVPVVEKPELIEALKCLELDQEIPEELFEAVAALLNQIEEKSS
jgi:flagellar biosynthesis protein